MGKEQPAEVATVRIPAVLLVDEEGCVLVECSGCMRADPGAEGWLAEVQVQGRSVFTGVLCAACKKRVMEARKP